MVVKLCLLTMIFFTYIHCVVVVPERANVTSWSDKYLHYGRIYITRKSRKSPYYINIEGKPKHTWGNNVTVHVIFYEYVHNEYRRTFIEIHSHFCDLVGKDPFIGRMLKNTGIICPNPPAEYHLLNMTIPTEDFKYTVPFEKFRVDIDITTRETKELMIKGYLYASFKTK